MKITPKKGFVLVSHQEIVEQKKSGLLLLPGSEKKKIYLRLESDGEQYKTGDCVLANPYKTKMEIEDNLYLIEENEILASLVL